MRASKTSEQAGGAFGPRRRLGLLKATEIPLVFGAIALLATGCGGDNSEAVAHIGKTTPTTPVPPAAAPLSGGMPTIQQLYRDAVAYTACMRSRGDPNFPAPTMVNNAQQQTVGWDQQLKSARDRSANRTCKYLLPNFNSGPSQAQVQQALANGLKFSQCMRAHGVPNFPDPKQSGQGISIGPAPGLSLSSPRFQAAQHDCRSLAPFGR